MPDSFRIEERNAMKHQVPPAQRPNAAGCAIVDSKSFDVGAAVALLRNGAILGIPTETVYGLGADAASGLGCAKIFEAKGRPSFNPLIAHCSDLDMAIRYGTFSAEARKLAEAFWPGPLTLVVERRPDCRISDLVTTGLPTIALRVPNAPVMQTLIRGLWGAIAAPSANRSGHVSATTGQAVSEDLGSAVAMIIDAGPSPVGLESTIVDVSGDHPVLLRAGGLPRDEIEAVLGVRLHAPQIGEGERPAAPGMLASHYAPSCPVRPDADEVLPAEGLLGFGCTPIRGQETADHVINLSPSGDLREAAAKLFSALRSLDDAGVTTIAVAPIPNRGLGEAINDRLRRAAVGRGTPT